MSWTDGETTQYSKTALCVASHGKNTLDIMLRGNDSKQNNVNQLKYTHTLDKINLMCNILNCTTGKLHSNIYHEITHNNTGSVIQKDWVGFNVPLNTEHTSEMTFLTGAKHKTKEKVQRPCVWTFYGFWSPTPLGYTWKHAVSSC